MTERFAVMPFSLEVMPSATPAGPEDDDEILFEPPEDLEPDASGDAAHADDAGPAEAPTRAALRRHRVKEALQSLQAEGPVAPEVRALDWRLVVQAKVLGAPLPAGHSSTAVVDARLDERDARGEANKPELDRPKGSEGAVPPKAFASVWGEQEPPRMTRRAPLPSWASLGIDPADPACLCKCRGRWAKSSKEQLIHAVLREQASGIPERLLRENYTKLGLRALLCGALCGDGDGVLKAEGAGRLPPARGARAPQLHRP